jgi:hypothetical protein
MNGNTRHPSTARRNFLKGLAAVGGLVAASGVAEASKGGAGAVAPTRSPPPRGYRLTPHVAKYYGKARF